LALCGGFCEVVDDLVTVMAGSAQLPSEIDVAAAQREPAEAEAVLGSVSDEARAAQALAKLETAVTRIQVASRAR
jgi:F-type H+-transporting ATPase subunit epsilon